jgi:putative chitinase
MNKTSFFLSIKQSLFGGRLTQGVVDTANAIIDYYTARYSCPKCLAYILATAYHEAYSTRYNPQWRPVREGYASSNEEAIKHVTERLFNKGLIRTNYAKPDANGASYYGRGLVQITWARNYANVGAKLGLPLYVQPDMALQLDVAVQILVEGCVNGWFTGRRVGNYFVGGKEDPINARTVVNGLDKADLIANHYFKFKAAIAAATEAIHA